MSASLLTINTTIPAADRPGTPVVVLYENGDWEIAFAGDMDYIQEGNSAFYSAHPFAEIFALILIFFEIGDEDDLDVSDGVIYFELSEKVTKGAEEEPVLLIYTDGEMDVIERYHAENMVRADTSMQIVQNFIPLLELFEDFETFRSRHEDIMFGEADMDDVEEEEDE